MLNGDVIGAAQFEALQHAMKQLEMKYTQTMRDKADLSDKNEQLEHMIMQLEGETETIGQYVHKKFWNLKDVCLHAVQPQRGHFPLLGGFYGIKIRPFLGEI